MRLLGRVVLGLVVAAVFGHRLAVVLSAGDFLYPLEPSEAKNTQIAWDLLSGRFGTDDYTLRNYVVNTGSIHHGSCTSAALAFWLVTRVFGFTMPSVRLVPLLAWTAGLTLWGETLRRRVGTLGMVLSLLGLMAVPTLFMAMQLTFLGCHPESTPPLAATVAAWLAWLDDPNDPKGSFVLATCEGYSLILSYLLWPFLALMAALSFLPPWPKPGEATLGAGALGGLVGPWPPWLIVALGGLSTLTGSAITENPETSLLQTAPGMEVEWSLFTETFWSSLPHGFQDFWMSHPDPPRIEPWAISLEEIAYPILVFGPLLLLPWALTDRDPRTRRLGVLTAIAPLLAYSWLAFASPWKPHVPLRYFMPFALFGFSAPGIGVGLALRRLGRPGWTRGLGLPLLLVCAAWLVAIAPLRWTEATQVLRAGRTDALLEHRHVAYYNAGMATVWASMVPDINDLIDVRSASGDPGAFQGIQAGSGGASERLGLGRGSWEPPDLTWDEMTAGLDEWGDRNSYSNPADRDDPAIVARSVGWGTGAPAGWDLERVAAAMADGGRAGEWPEQLPVQGFWRGVGEPGPRRRGPTCPTGSRPRRSRS